MKVFTVYRDYHGTSIKMDDLMKIASGLTYLEANDITGVDHEDMDKVFTYFTSLLGMKIVHHYGCFSLAQRLNANITFASHGRNELFQSSSIGSHRTLAILTVQQLSSIKFLRLHYTRRSSYIPSDDLSRLPNLPSLELLSLDSLELEHIPFTVFNLPSLKYFHCREVCFHPEACISLRRSLLNCKQLKAIKLEVSKLTNKYEIMSDHCQLEYFRSFSYDTREEGEMFEIPPHSCGYIVIQSNSLLLKIYGS